MCFFGGEIGWMEKFGEKMERKTFLSVFGWVEMKENKWWDLGVFFLDPLKSFLPKSERKLKGEIGHHFWTKMPMCNCTRASSTLLFFTPFFFFYLLDVAFYFLLGRHCLTLFFFFFYLLGRLVHFFYYFYLFYFILFFGLDVIFFMDIIFIF